MHGTITKNKARNIILLMIYYFALILSYLYWLSPRYSYMGFVSSGSVPCAVIGVIAAFALSCAASNLIERGRCSDLMILFLILLYFFPQIVLFAHCLNDYVFFAFVVCYLALLLLFNRLIELRTRRFRVNESMDLFIVAVTLLGAFMLALSGRYAGFRISFDLSDFYEYRYAVREMMLPTVARYLFSWTKQFLPIGLVYAIIRKKWGLAAFMSLSVVFCFSFDGKKSVLFMFFLALVIGFLYKRKYIRSFPLFMIGLNAAIMLEKLVRHGDSFLGKHILRRLMFIPARLGWSFYDFFSVHELDYLRSSVLRRFGFQSPYSDSIPRIIAIANNSYNSRGVSNANTGLCGDAFANFGWASVLIYPLMITLVFKLLEKYLCDLDERLQVIVCITVSYAMLSGAFFTVLLTNGVLLMILLLMIVPRRSRTLLTAGG